MTPPIQNGAALAVPRDTCDLSSIDLTEIKTLPDFNALHPLQKGNPLIKNSYALFNLGIQIDEKIGNKEGSQNGLLESQEVENFIRTNNEQGNEIPIDHCTFMEQFRLFAKDLPQIKSELAKEPDTSPIPRVFFSELPYLKEFSPLTSSILEHLGNPEKIQEIIQNSALPQALKTLFAQNNRLITVYITANDYAVVSESMNGQISLEKMRARMAEDGLSTEEANQYFYQMKSDAIPMANLTLDLREELNLAPPKGFFSLKEIAFLAQMVPELIQAHPELSALIDAVFPPGLDGKPMPTSATADLIISFDEFRESDFIKHYAALGISKGVFPFFQTKTSEEIFASFQAVRPALSVAISLWPRDLKTAFEKIPKEKRDLLQMVMNLPEHQQQIDFVIRMMEAESTTKYAQERDLDHPSENKGFMVLNGITWLLSGGESTYGNYFHNTRPQKHKDTRDAAIQALRETILSNNFQSIEEATSFMANHGQTDSVKVLNEQCSLGNWLTLSKITDNVDRNREILKLAEAYREGEWGNFWDWQIFPSPSLGRGGFFERASDFDNWQWGKSPQTVTALALNSHLAVETPNNYREKHLADFSILSAQIPDTQARAFSALVERVQKGETVPIEDIQKVVASDQLSASGQEELLAQIKLAMLKVENQKILADPNLKAEYEKLNDEQKKEALHLLGSNEVEGAISLLFSDPSGDYNPNNIRKAVESMDSTFDQIIDVDISKEKQLVLGLQEKKFPDTFLRALVAVLGKMKRIEGIAKPAVAIDALFREGQFSNLPRVRELFELPTHSSEQLQEFSDLVKSSRLSAANQERLLGIMLLQPNTLVAEAAEANFMAILGHPEIDPISGEYSSRYTGNLHSSIRTTLHRGVFGAGAMAAPTFISGSIGQAVFKSIQNHARIPREEITGLRRLLGFRGVHRLGNNALAKKLTMNFSTKLGAYGAAAAGTLVFFSITPYGDQLRDFSHEAWTYPYFPWSDMAVRDLPLESIQTYLSINASLQGMDSVLMGAKTIGALEIGTRVSNVVRGFEIGNRLAKRLDKLWPKGATWLRGNNSTAGLGLQGFRGLLSRMKSGILGKTESQIAEETLKSAERTAPWAADVAGLNSAERIWAKSAYEKACQELATKRAYFGGKRYNEIYDELAMPGLDVAQRQVLAMELQIISQGLTDNAKRLIMQHEIRVRSLRVLGQVGHNPAFSKSILKRAQKWQEEGLAMNKPELVDRSWALIEKGGAQYAQLPLMEFQNRKLAQFMLWMLFNESVDEATRHPTPVVPEFPEPIAPGHIQKPIPGKDHFPMR